MGRNGGARVQVDVDGVRVSVCWVPVKQLDSHKREGDRVNEGKRKRGESARKSQEAHASKWLLRN